VKVRFKANGKWVSFATKPGRKKRSGKVPKHLKPFLFKAGKASKRGGSRRGSWPKGKTPPHLKKARPGMQWE
jgi:hypothetical protein